MARRKSYNSGYTDISYPSYSYNMQNPSVLSSIVYSILLTIVILSLALFVGPIADYFTNLLMLQAGNPYASPIITLFQWWYYLLFASWVMGQVIIWKVVFSNVSFEGF